MIAELRSSRLGRSTRVFLDDDLQWRCDADHALAALLNQAHPIPEKLTEVHRPALHELYQVAARLGAEVLREPSSFDLESIRARCH